MNLCRNCNVPINEGETYCTKCQDQLEESAAVQYTQAVMRGDILTANRILADNPNLKMVMTISGPNNESFKVCQKCSVKNKMNSNFCINCGAKF